MDLVHLLWPRHTCLATDYHHHSKQLHSKITIVCYKKSCPFVITIFKLGLGFSRYGREPPPEPTSPINLSGNEVGHHHHHHHHHHESFSSSRSGQILWIRGLTRLQTQVGQVNSLFLCFSISSPTLSFDFFSLSIVYSEKKRFFFTC